MKRTLTFILYFLNNLSNINRRINAQGHTETWYMSIPRYAMLHVQYRLNIMPHKNQND